jgi:uncharacterized protein
MIESSSYGSGGSRSDYIYDYAYIITDEYEQRLDNYLRALDDNTTAEIVVYTISSFVGHGIEKDGHEIQDRDRLANYIFNEVPLDGITGIGKKGKDNGILVLLSLNPDASGGSMRIEVGRGLENIITNDIAGKIFDAYLVPAKDEYLAADTVNKTILSEALFNTVIELGYNLGFTGTFSYNSNKTNGQIPFWLLLAVFSAIVALVVIIAYDVIKRHSERKSDPYSSEEDDGVSNSGFGSWFSSGGFGGSTGGGYSGGGAGR